MAMPKNTPVSRQFMSLYEHDVARHQYESRVEAMRAASRIFSGTGAETFEVIAAAEKIQEWLDPPGPMTESLRQELRLQTQMGGAPPGWDA